MQLTLHNNNCYLISVVVVVLVIINTVRTELFNRRHEYKYTFKAPYVAQRDDSVPFWEIGGNAIASAENIRLAPSMQSQKGAIWSKYPIGFQWFDVEIVFRISGRGRIGADGLAFWYVKEKGDYKGNVFGSSDKWNGFGLFFDSFDNDNKGNNPYVMGMVNDGTREYKHESDGSEQGEGCARPFRNQPHPSRVKVEYVRNVITVQFYSDVAGKYELCFRMENVFLPPSGYFGLSAATGGLADDHDVIRFEAHSLIERDEHAQAGPTAEQKRMMDEYMRQQEKFEHDKTEYIKEHPDYQPTKEPTLDEWYETETQRDFKHILDGQNRIYRDIHELSQKLDQVIGRQEHTMSLLSGGGGSGGGHPPPLPPQQRTDQLAHSQNQILAVCNELRQFLLEIKQRTDTILNVQTKQPTAHVQSIGYDTQSLVAEMRDGLNTVKQNLGQMSQFLTKNTGQPTGHCPPPTNCVTITTLLVVIAGHLVIVLGYLFYRDNKDYQSKKFY